MTQTTEHATDLPPLWQPCPEKHTDATLPDYSGEATTCVKCSHSEALTYYRAAIRRCVVEYNDVTAARGPLPERLERVCHRCGYQWDEALNAPTPPARPALPGTPQEFARTIRESFPFPLDPEVAAFIETGLVQMMTGVLSFPDAPSTADTPVTAEPTEPAEPPQPPTPTPTTTAVAVTVDGAAQHTATGQTLYISGTDA
ncbi:hypothetical protein [Embleya sp. NPDC001921]